MYGKSIFQAYRFSRIQYYFKRNSIYDVLAKMSKPKSQDFKASAPPSNVYLQVIGSGARGAASSLYLFTDHNRYLFNCGEATQRIALEHKIKVSRLNHIFITNKSWKNLGGLPGLTITLQQVGLSNIVLHGPDGLDSLYNATKGFVVLKDLSVNLTKCVHGEEYVDNALSIKYVCLYPQNVKTDDVPDAKRAKLDSPMSPQQNFEQFTNDRTDYYKREKRKTPSPPIKFTSRPSSPNNVDESDSNKCSIAYICTLRKRLGTLQLDKCVEFGVKPGPLLGKLKNGEDVILPDGTVVLSKDVKTPDDPGPVFIVIEVPDLSYLKESEFSAHFDNGTNPPENVPVLIVHFTPSEVLCTPRYQEFMSKFGSSTQHLLMNEQNTCLGSEAVHRIQHKLHLLEPQVFPLLRDISIPLVCDNGNPKTNSPVLVKGIEELKNKFQSIVNLESLCEDKIAGLSKGLQLCPAHTLTTFHLRPTRDLDRSQEPRLNFQEYIQEITDVDGFFDSLDKFRDISREVRRSVYPEYPKVLFLGTGSSMPGKTRNVSAIAVFTSVNRSILLDCGEGTHVQITRFFGQKSNEFLMNLRAVYISHLHADHHLGLLGVLQARRRAFIEANLAPEPLYVVAPGQIMTWLSIYHKQFEPILQDIQLVPNQFLVEGPTKLESDVLYLTPPMLVNMGLKDIKTCYVSHCPNAYGVALYIDEYKVTYSGDTIPCQELIDLGKDSTILIHEATMEDELEKDARYKMHSTMSQAIEVGQLMNAKFTILTHFSQRYARIPRFNAEDKYKNVGIAYDNMQVTLNDLDILPHMFAPLHIIFAEHCLEMDQKAALRKTHAERLSKIRAANMPSSISIDKSMIKGS